MLVPEPQPYPPHDLALPPRRIGGFPVPQPPGGYMDPMPPIHDPQWPTMPLPPGAGSLPGGIKRWPKSPFGGGGIGDPMPDPRFPRFPTQPISSPWRRPGPIFRPQPRPGPRPIVDPTPDPLPWGPNPPTARPDFRNQPSYGNRGRPGGYYGPSQPPQRWPGKLPSNPWMPTYPGSGDPVLMRSAVEDSMSSLMKLFGG